MPYYDEREKEMNGRNFASKERVLAELYNKGASKEAICVYKILLKRKTILSGEIISIASSAEFAKDCLLCASADGLYRGLKDLQEWGYCICFLQKGGYAWGLTNNIK
ncbi:MAG: hypothetical protein K9W42_05860 [Candidatus Heimdallarchaeota archaeon]|nr:hypothetical protein [Candidatus Heimdallarchaeota archaeon]